MLLLLLVITAVIAVGSPSCPDIFQETAAQQPLPPTAAVSSSSSSSSRWLLHSSRLAELTTPLAIPRAVGSPGHSLVRNRLADFLRRLGDDLWRVELDSFVGETPLGRRSFDNVVATLTRRPGARRRVVLAAHYDSKMLPKGFIGATDSAVPCAILLAMAEALTKQVATTRMASDPDVTVQLVFFDGEEAFEQWTRSDSLYGSRHLAERWSTEEGANPSCQSAREIEALVLLDLIGGRDPRFYYSPHPAAERVVAKEMRLFEELVATETDMRRLPGRLSSSGRHHRYFQWPELGSGTVQDDQTPFQEIGVPAVHVIPQPFPSVWHTPGDTLDAVDWDQTADVATIVLTWLAHKVGLRDDSI